jgi:hypothetical protein
MNRRGFFGTLVGVLLGSMVVPAAAQQWQGPGGIKIQKKAGKWYVTGNRHRIEDVEWAIRHIDQDLALSERRPTITIEGIEIVYPRR